MLLRASRLQPTAARRDQGKAAKLARDRSPFAVGINLAYPPTLAARAGPDALRHRVYPVASPGLLASLKKPRTLQLLFGAKVRVLAQAYLAPA